MFGPLGLCSFIRLFERMYVCLSIIQMLHCTVWSLSSNPKLFLKTDIKMLLLSFQLLLKDYLTNLLFQHSCRSIFCPSFRFCSSCQTMSGKSIVRVDLQVVPGEPRILSRITRSSCRFAYFQFINYFFFEKVCMASNFDKFIQLFLKSH